MLISFLVNTDKMSGFLIWSSSTVPVIPQCLRKAWLQFYVVSEKFWLCIFQIFFQTSHSNPSIIPTLKGVCEHLIIMEHGEKVLIRQFVVYKLQLDLQQHYLPVYESEQILTFIQGTVIAYLKDQYYEVMQNIVSVEYYSQ